MSDGIGTFVIDTRDMRAMGEVVDRSRVRLNRQDPQNPNWEPLVRNISMLDPYRDPTSINTIYSRAMAAVRRHVSQDANVLAGRYGLVISAFAQTNRPNVVTINIGHGNFLSNQSYSVLGDLDSATRAGLTYVASLVQQIRQSNPSANIVLMGAFNGGTIANLASVTLGLPAVTFMSNPLSQSLVDASVDYVAGLSVADPTLVPPPVAADPYYNSAWRVELTPFQTIDLDDYIFETVRLTGTESFSYDDSLLRQLNPLISGLENAIGPAKAAKKLRDGLDAFAQEIAITLGQDAAKNKVGDLLDAVARGDQDAAYAIAGGNEKALEWLSDLSWSSFGDSALVMNQSDLSDLIAALGSGGITFGPGNLPSDFTPEQFRLLRRGIFAGNGVSQYAQDETTIGYLRSAVNVDPDFINKLVKDGGFNSVTSIVSGSSFLKNNSIYGKFSKDILFGLRGGVEGADISAVIHRLEGGARFDRLLWQFTSFMIEVKGVEPNRQDIETLYASIIGKYDDGGARGLTQFLGEILSDGQREQFFEQVAQFAFDYPGNSAGSRPMENTCFPAGTKILSADGKQISVEDLRPGDAVSCFSEEAPFGPLLRGTVTDIVRRKASKITTINGLRCTYDHKLLNADGDFQAADSFHVGSHVIDADGRQVEVSEHVVDETDEIVFAVTIAPHATLIADGLRVHNEARCSIYDEFFRIDENLAIKTDIRADGTIVMEYIDGRGVKTGERIISDKVTLDRIYKEYIELNGLEERDGDGVYRPKLPPAQIEEIYRSEISAHENAEMLGSLGNALGSILGERIAGRDVALGIALKSTLGTALENIFEAASVGHFWSELPLSELEILGNVEVEFAGNLTGAVSSYLIAELIATVGINGIPGEVFQTSAGSVVSTMVQNLLDGAGAFDGIGGALGNSIGSFIGTKLASEIVSFDTIGGQIGSSLGATAGSIFGAKVITAIFPKLLSSLSWAGGPVGAAVGAFLGFIAGGLIGSIFGGTPRSGADVQWDERSQKFTVANVYSKKGGSKDSARSIAGGVADSVNSILNYLGGVLENPESIQGGNYGMRGKAFVYRPYSSREKSAITMRFSGANASSDLAEFGLKTALTDVDFNVWGGSVIIKRAFYNYMDRVKAGQASFDTSELFGNLASASSFEAVFGALPATLSLASASSGTVEAVELAVALVRGHELGLDKRARSDWFGGFGYLQGTSGFGYEAFEFKLVEDAGSRQLYRKLTFGEYQLQDLVAIGAQDRVSGTSANEVIDARGGDIDNIIGLTVNGMTRNNVALGTVDFSAGAQLVLFSAGSSRTTRQVGVVSDQMAENSEKFVLEISNAGNLFVADRQAVVTIAEKGSNAHLIVGDSYVATTDSHLVFRISLSKSVGGVVSSVLELASADGETLSAAVEISANGVDNWTASQVAVFSSGVTELFARVPVAAVSPGRPTNSANYELGVAGEINLKASAISGLEFLAEGAETSEGSGKIIEDGDDPRNFVWIDDAVVHEESGTSLASVGRSRANAGSSVTVTAREDSSLRIAIAATIDGGFGSDALYASDNGDNLIGGAGNDQLYGGRLDDWLFGGDGDDSLDAGTADPLALGGDGNYLDGGAGNDIIRGREGSDWLEGGDGVDIITGGAGDDILSGGAGDGDDLKGGSGADQYLLRRGDGADIVEEDAAGAPVPFFSGNAMFDRILGIETWKTDPGSGFAIRPDWNGSAAGVEQGAIAGGEDAVVFGAGIDIGDIRLKRSEGASAPGDDLIIEVMQTDEEGVESFSGTQLTVRGWFSNAFKRVEWLKFADGNEIRIGDVRSFIVGGFNDDLLIGTDGNDFVYGGAGNDQLLLLAGDDIGNGASGNDKVWGDEGRDLIIGGTGVDELIGGAGADAISGDAGADDIYGGADNDVLSGGRGDGDVVIGGAGDDIFKFARGDGRDMYLDELTDHWDVVWSASGNWNTAAGFNYNTATGEVTGPGGAILRKNFGTATEPDFQWVGRFDYDSASGTLKYFNPPAGATIVANSGSDMIEFALGINIQDVILRKVGNDLVMAISSENADIGDSSAVSDSITIKDWYLSPGQIELLSFYATGMLSIAPGDTNLIAGTDGVDGSLTTPLSGTVLADWITAGAGDDIVAGGSGNDIIAGNSGSDTLRGEAGDDVLYGGAGNDILEGGSGRDILIGGSGTDAASYASASGAMRVRLSFQTANSGDAAGDEYDSIENVVGGSGADNLGGDEGENEITGGAGADMLMGGAADDTYVWTATSGADTIREGAFAVEEAVTAMGVLADGYSATWTNTWAPSTSGKYYWRLEIRGPGNELVYDYALYSYASGTAMPAPTAWNTAGWLGGFSRTNGQQVTRDKFDTSISGGDQDTIEFAAGISLSDLTFIRATDGVADTDGPDLIIRYGGSSSSQLTVKGHFTVYGRVETLQFNDGMAVPLDSILSATSGAALHGTAEADLIVGQSDPAADLLYGGLGDDVLSGLEGDDQLYGEGGDDVLEGGAGADRLDGGANAVDGRGDTVRYVRSGAVGIDLRLTTGQTGADAAGDVLVGIENVVGSQTGNDTITGDDNANIIDGLDGNNIIDGQGGDDVLIAGSGSDIIRGGGGEDNVSAGDGNDQVWGGAEDDILVGGGGGDQLRGEAGNDQLLGGDGDDLVLDGGIGDDEIYGGAGNDALTGGDGNDRLGGGTGSDTLHGGAGDDYYFVEANDGADTLVDASGVNIIGFDTGISHDRIWLTRSGSDLKVSVIGENTVLTVSGFFAASSPSRIKSIQTSTHALFLDHPDTLNLIAAMTAASATAPASVPQAIADAQARYWHQGGKAKPIGPTAPRAIATTEDVAITMDGNYGVVDHDNDISGYQLKTGSGPSKGVISNFDPATGALTYTPGADAKGTDSFVVIVTDASGHSVELPVNVTIASINDAPDMIAVKGGGNLVIAESAPGNIVVAGTIVGEFEAVDAEGDAITYTLVEDAGGRFAMTAEGKLIVTDPGAVDFEASASHMVRVRATDANGAYSEQDFTVAVENRNEANSMPASYSMSVAENVAAGTLVGSVAAIDPDQSGVFAQQRYYFWDGTTASAISSDGRYAINATTGQITVNGALNFEAASPSKSYQVIARDNGGASGFNQALTTVTIGIADVNETNSLPASYNLTVNENVAVGTVVGSVAATDLDNAGTTFAQQRYYFWNAGAASSLSSDGRYEIDALTGTITTNSSLDFEAGTTSATYQVVAQDNAGGAGYSQAQTAVTIGIANLNEANSLPASYSMAVNENVALGTVVGAVVATDMDSAGVAFGQQRYYFWDGATASATSGDGRYAIDAMTGQITVNAALNFEAGTPSKTYQVIARDNAGGAGYHQAQSEVTIAIADLNEAPVSLNWMPLVAQVAERDRVAAGTVRPAIALGALSVTDPDTAGLPSAVYSYTVSDTRFEVVGDTLRLKQDASFDYEAGASVTVTVTGTDGTGTPFTIDRTIVIAVTDIDDIWEGAGAADVIVGQSGRDIISGFAGNDTLSGGAGNDSIDGGDGADTLYGDDGADLLLGQLGDDLLHGGLGNDILRGGDDDDRLFGEDGDDSLYGDAGAEGVRAGGSESWRGFAEAGLVGGIGNDLLDGGAGDDYLDGGAGADQLIGGDGFDGADYSGSNAAVTVNLATGTGIGGHAQGDTLSGIELVQGSGFGDTITGSAGADVIYGGAGNDTIYGGAGNDYLFGGDGNDTIDAQAGDDVLDGGAGDDILNGGIDNDLYVVTRSSGADTINNYDPSGDDVDVIGFNDVMGAINDRDLWFERIGDDLKISVIGTGASISVTDWYVVADADSRANHKIDFIVANTSFSRTINIEGLVTLMATKTKPATTAARDTLMADLAYKAMWATHWNANAAPTLSAIAQQSTNEDGAKVISVTATDDITPNTQVQLSAQVISGTNVVTNAGISFGTPNSSGVRSMTINPVANASGTARIRVTATDAGGISSSQEFDIVVAAVADTPTVTQFTSAGGTSGQAGGIALNLATSFPDADGSETHQIWITGVPSGITLSAGTYDSASATWRLTPAQLGNLKVNAPAGWSQDLNLTATARATENGQTAISVQVNLKLAVNTAPTGITIRGLGSSATPWVYEYTPANDPAGQAVGTAAVVDPDAPDNNLFPADFSELPLIGIGEERIVTATGPSGGAVQVLETGQNGDAASQRGGGLAGLSMGPADISKAYKFTIYFKPENNMGHSLYFGTLGSVQNAWDGQANSNPYFYTVNSDSLVQDRWYRIEAYILPAGSALIDINAFGGVFDTVTGAKVANTKTFRFSENGSDTAARFFSFYNETNAGYSAQWYQPTVERLDYSYQLLDSAGGRFAINSVTGLITATGANLNHEANTTHNITVRVTDAFGAYRDQTIAVAVNNLNETNSLPSSYSMAVDENAAAGTLVGTVTATDIDSAATAFGQQRYYFLNGTIASATSSDGRYAINATTGKITVNGALNFEAGTTSVTYIVIARDNAGAAGYTQVQSSVTIAVNNVNEQNSLPASYSFAVNENSGIGAIVGTVVATDLDVGGTFASQRYYFLNGTTASAISSDGRYTINATTGQITTYAALNYEAGTPSATYTVIARDNAGAGAYTQDQTSVTVGINNLNEANNIAASYSFGVNENVAVGTAIGTVAATDLDSSSVAFGQQRYYFLNGTTASATSSDGRYKINATTGQVTTNAALNYEAGTPSATYTVIARDNAGAAGYHQDQTSVTIGVNNVNEANSISASYSFAVNENVGIGTAVGTVAASDIDSSSVAFGQQRYYFLNGTTASSMSSDGRYTINATTGQITTKVALNYEAGTPSATYTVIARDNTGAAGYHQVQTSVTIGINNLNEANSLPASYSMTVNENVAVGTVVGSVAASDIDSPSVTFGQQRYYFLNGSAISSASSDGRYTINATTGAITTKTALDFDVGTPHGTYTVVARDNAGATGYNQDQANVTITIGNVDELHTMSNLTIDVNESNAALGPSVPVGNFLSMFNDPEDGANIQFRFTNDSTQMNGWQIDPASGQIWMISAKDYEALTDVYENVMVRDYPEPEWEWRRVGKDPSRAIFNLGVVATNLVTGASAQGTLTINVKDVNEDVTHSSYITGSSKGTWIKISNTEYRILANTSAVTRYITPSVYDPEGQAISYSISNLSYTEYNIVAGGSSEINASAMPTITINSAGQIGFHVPNQDWDGEWEGGLKIGGYRRTSSVDATFILNIVNGDITTQVPMKITFVRRGSSVPPLIFDLDGDGLEITSADGSTVQFDMDGDGIRDTTGWAGADDGFLALDRNGNGLIDDIGEISFVADAEGAMSDLEGLRTYDSDGDGYFDDGDAQFGSFLIWRDGNHDGISQAHEMKTLGEWGIRAINLSMTLTGNADEGDNILFATTDYEKVDGTTGSVGDVFLSYDPSDIEDIAPPIVLDFDGDGNSLTEMADNKVRFDMNGDGIADKTGWIEQGDAFLGLDRNDNGKIDDLAEISFVADKEGAKTDLEGLAAFDSNGDGALSGEDARFAEFKLWFDNNGNGVTDAGELLSLAQAGVVSISLAGVASGEQAVSGKNIVYNTGSFMRANGETGKLLDTGLAFKALSALPEIEFQTSTWTAKSKAYRLNASGGIARIVPRGPRGVLSADAGQIAAAAMISTRSGDYGLLSSILVDLDGDGLEAKRAGKAKARFDMNGDGLRDDTGWASGGDGMLIIDRDKDGKITHASELSFLSEKEDAKNSWEGLAALDSNKDGKLDKSDTRFGELKVWVDGNGDGISQEGELRTLADLSIAEIGLRNAATSDSVKLGHNLALSTATFKRENGTTATIGNVALGFEAAKVPARSPGGPTGPREMPSIDQLDAARAASNLAQAMSRFGVDGANGDLRGWSKDGMAPHDWFTAAVA